MSEVVLGIIAVLLSVLGAAAVIRWAALSIAAPRKGNTRIYAVRLKGENADIEIKMAIDTAEWNSALKGAEKFAIDCGLEDETREICERLCKGTDFMFLNAFEMGDRMYSSFDRKV